ncbi:MAG: cyclic nucleotide-binding domain-containing protein, partial [Bacteroidota bacterium]
ILMLTARDDDIDQVLGLEVGADDYLTKPFNHVELLEAVDIRLKKSARLNKAFQQNPMTQKTLLDETRGQKELEQLAEARDQTAYHKKDIIFAEGELPRRLFHVTKGTVKTFRTNEFGKELITGVYKEGDFFGFQALLEDGPYHESAAAMEDAVVSYIPKLEFIQLLSGSRDFTARFIKMLANNVSEKEEQLIQLAYNSIRKRVADALVKLNQQYREAGDVRIDILRDDLASMVGTAKESVSRMLTDFKSEKLIEIDHLGVITVLDERKLARLPN